MFLFYFQFLFFFVSLANEWAKANDQKKNSDSLKDELHQCHAQLSGILSAAKSYHHDREDTNWQINEKMRQIEDKKKMPKAEKEEKEKKEQKKQKRKWAKEKMEEIFKREKRKQQKSGGKDEMTTDEWQKVRDNLGAIGGILRCELSQFAFIADTANDLLTEISLMHQTYELCAAQKNCLAKKGQFYHHMHNISQIWREFERDLLPCGEYERMAREKANLVTTTQWPRAMIELRNNLLEHFAEDDSDVRSPKFEYSIHGMCSDMKKIVEKCETIVGTLFLGKSPYGEQNDEFLSADRLHFTPSDSASFITEKTREKSANDSDDTSPNYRRINDEISPKFEFSGRGETSDTKAQQNEEEEKEVEEEKEEIKEENEMERPRESAEFYSAKANGKLEDQLRQNADILDNLSKLAKQQGISRGETAHEMGNFGDWVAAELGKKMAEFEAKLAKIEKERKKREKFEKKATRKWRKKLPNFVGGNGEKSGGSQSSGSGKSWSSGSSKRIHAEENLEVLNAVALTNKADEIKKEMAEMPLKLNEFAKIKKILENEFLRYKAIWETTEKLAKNFQNFAELAKKNGQMFYKEKMEKINEIKVNFSHEIGVRMRVLRTDFEQMQSKKSELVHKNNLWLPWVEYLEESQNLRRLLLRQLIEEINEQNSMTKIADEVQQKVEFGLRTAKQQMQIWAEKKGRKTTHFLC